MVLFHGKGTVYEKELPKYHSKVFVDFNPIAYMNNILFLQYIELYLLPALGNKPSPYTNRLY